MIIAAILGPIIGIALFIALGKRFRNSRPKWSTSASRYVEIHTSEQQAVALVMRSLRGFEYRELPIYDEYEHKVEGTVQGNWKTYGNRLRIQLDAKRGSSTSLTIESWPSPPQFYDWGRSRWIVKHIVADLETMKP
jgi:hypothetical protein